jgi:hypothetical protein
MPRKSVGVGENPNKRKIGRDRDCKQCQPDGIGGWPLVAHAVIVATRPSGIGTRVQSPQSQKTFANAISVAIVAKTTPAPTTRLWVPQPDGQSARFAAAMAQPTGTLKRVVHFASVNRALLLMPSF